jgi:hypothetical protein
VRAPSKLLGRLIACMHVVMCLENRGRVGKTVLLLLLRGVLWGTGSFWTGFVQPHALASNTMVSGS